MSTFKFSGDSFESSVFLPSHFEDQSTFVFANSKLFNLDDIQKLPTDKDSRFWFATSGSTGIPKWVAIQKTSFLNSAKSVNGFYNLSEKDVFFQSLPLFHVGGLSIFARAHLLRAKVVTQAKPTKWSAKGFLNFISELEVSVVSLVPTQIFDICKFKLTAPSQLKFVFVGGGGLSEQLYSQARALGWPLIPTYGMTETSSMIAGAEPNSLKKDSMPSLTILPHAQIKKAPDGIALVQADSLLEGHFDTVKNEFFEHSFGKWFRTTDRLELSERKVLSVIRDSDTVKINGELISLIEIENVLKAQVSSNVKVMAFKDARNENQIGVCFKTKEWPKIHLKFKTATSIMPSIKVPHRVILLSHWPVDSMGKWNKNTFEKSLHHL